MTKSAKQNKTKATSSNKPNRTLAKKNKAVLKSYLEDVKFTINLQKDKAIRLQRASRVNICLMRKYPDFLEKVGQLGEDLKDKVCKELEDDLREECSIKEYDHLIDMLFATDRNVYSDEVHALWGLPAKVLKETVGQSNLIDRPLGHAAAQMDQYTDAIAKYDEMQEKVIDFETNYKKRFLEEEKTELKMPKFIDIYTGECTLPEKIIGFMKRHTVSACT